ncbi:hypothetical protein CEXT_741631 [Caerostris extrusa]|uniref:Uncharacterized protein n=1 Tax=Caerostris extrusa TaxID=172846 RepID=A0AAV4Q382_CAEEX|nr:hypothetical protein CEXT_741631 [Caerostris extrusa]
MFFFFPLRHKASFARCFRFVNASTVGHLLVGAVEFCTFQYEHKKEAFFAGRGNSNYLVLRMKGVKYSVEDKSKGSANGLHIVTPMPPTQKNSKGSSNGLHRASNYHHTFALFSKTMRTHIVMISILGNTRPNSTELGWERYWSNSSVEQEAILLGSQEGVIALGRDLRRR